MDSISEEMIDIASFQREEEISRYYIHEGMTSLERIQYILKKGDDLQKISFFNNIPTKIQKGLLDKETMEIIILNTIEHITLWTEKLQIAFGNMITQIFEKCTSEKIIELIIQLINPIMLAAMQIVVNDDQNIRNEYLLCLDEISNFCYNNQKIDISNEIIEYVVSLGDFSNPIYKRRCCVYFSAILFKSSLTINYEVVKKFMILTSDYERKVRIEISFHIKYLIQALDLDYLKKNVLKIMSNSVISMDNMIKYESINSMIFNFKKIYNDSYSDIFISKILSVINSDVTELFTHGLKIIRPIIHDLEYSITSRLYPLVEAYFENTYLNEEILSENLENLNNKELIPCISLILKFFNYHGNHGKGEKIIEIIFKLIYQEKKGISLDQSGNHEEIEVSSNCSLDKSYDENILLLIEYLPEILRESSRELKNNIIIKQFFVEENKIYLRKFIKFLEKIMLVELEKSNEDFFLVYISQISKLFEFLENEDWRIIKIFLETNIKFEKLYENEDYRKLINPYVLNLLDQKNYILQKDSIKILTLLIKYSPKAQSKLEILRFLEGAFLKQKNFYNRRLYLDFIEESVEKFSFNFLVEYGIINNILFFLSDKIPIIIEKLIFLISRIMVFLEENVKLKSAFQSKFELIRTNQLIMNDKMVYDEFYNMNDSQNSSKIAEFKRINQINLDFEKNQSHIQEPAFTKKKKSSQENSDFLKKKGSNGKGNDINSGYSTGTLSQYNREKSKKSNTVNTPTKKQTAIFTGGLIMDTMNPRKSSMIEKSKTKKTLMNEKNLSLSPKPQLSRGSVLKQFSILPKYK